MRKVICIDLDGTLINSTEAYILAFNEVFRKNKLLPVSSEELKNAFGEETEKIIMRFYPTINKRKLEKCIEDFSEALKKNYEKIKAVPGAESAIKTLRKKYKIALISNNFKEDIIDLLETSGIGFENFDLIISRDDVKEAKPNPEGIFKAKMLSKEKPEYIIGDTITDIIAGKTAGIKTIAVLTGAQSIKKLWKEKPTMIVNSIKEVSSIL